MLIQTRWQEHVYKLLSLKEYNFTFSCFETSVICIYIIFFFYVIYYEYIDILK